MYTTKPTNLTASPRFPGVESGPQPNIRRRSTNFTAGLLHSRYRLPAAVLVLMSVESFANLRTSHPALVVLCTASSVFGNPAVGYYWYAYPLTCSRQHCTLENHY